MEFNESGVQGLHPIGQALRERIAAKVEARLGGAHRRDIEPAHDRDVLGEECVEPIDFILQLALGAI